MKKIALSALFLLQIVFSQAQQDTSLLHRLQVMMKITQLKDIEKVLDYTYPKLFTIAPRDVLLKTMKETYDTEEYIVELDSVNIHTLFPVFRINDTNYVKVKHTMLMKMKFKEPQDTSDAESANFLVQVMEGKYGKGNVRFDNKANSLNIFMISDMAGVKPANGQWTFLNLDEDNPAMLEMLFSKRVRDKLSEFK